MKKVIHFPIIFVLMIAFLSTGTRAQGLKLGVGGGLTLVQGPDGYTNDINNNGSGFSNEYHFGIKAKISVPLVPLTPYGQITFHKFSGSGTGSLGGNIETSQSILSIGVGGELSIVPGPVSPYFAFEVAMNSMGDYEKTAPLIYGGNTIIGGKSRFGAALGIGTEITFLPLVNFDVSAKYNWFNLVGKDDGEDTISAVTLNALLLFSAI